MQAIHTTALPAALAARIPQEDFAPRWRNSVKAFAAQVAKEGFDDPVAARLAALWRTKRDEIASMVARAEQLAPKEWDLMFIGGGVGGAWHDEQEARWFYQGYGRAEVTTTAWL